MSKKIELPIPEEKQVPQGIQIDMCEIPGKD